MIIVAVVGATGSQGGAVVRSLSQQDDMSVRAITRDPGSSNAQKLTALPNVTAVKADTSQPETLMAAFNGVDIVFGITNYYDKAVQEDPLEEARQGCKMADAAKACGVKLFIWSTVPSALIRTGAKYRSNGLTENKHTVSQYLKHIGLPHVDLYVGFYMDNLLNFNQFARTADGAIEIYQPILKPETRIGMFWVRGDLGPMVCAIIRKFEQNQLKLGSSIYCVAGMHCIDDVAQEVKRQLGVQARALTVPTTGFKDLDEMFQYYNEWGVYNEYVGAVPDQNAQLEIAFRPLEEWVRQEVVPHIKTLS